MIQARSASDGLTVIPRWRFGLVSTTQADREGLPCDGPMMVKNLTCYEIDSLPHSFNLTDGHAFRRWLVAEEAIIDRAVQLFKNNDRRRQPEIEREYVRDFSRLARQTCDEEALGYLMCFTASMAFEIVANYLRLNRLRLALVEPCFDNLADIFRRHAIPTRPLPDSWLDAPPGAHGSLKRLLQRIPVSQRHSSVLQWPNA
jgi:hypothetical protein